jgi:hypothetical protein
MHTNVGLAGMLADRAVVVTAAKPAQSQRSNAMPIPRAPRNPPRADLTSEVLYQLSYVGEKPANPPRIRAGRKGREPSILP